MMSFPEILRHWTPAELRDDLDVSYFTAASMIRRGAVASRHWSALLSAARRKGLALDEGTLIHIKSGGGKGPPEGDAA